MIGRLFVESPTNEKDLEFVISKEHLITDLFQCDFLIFTKFHQNKIKYSYLIKKSIIYQSIFLFKIAFDFSQSMGYDSKLFVQEPSYDLICGICLDVFENCYITKCQHRYCLYCLQLILTTNEQECSYDRIKIIKEDCRVDKEVNEIVENLPINCQTCNKEISIKTLKTHDCGKQKEGMVIKGNNDIYTENSFKNWYKDILIVDKEICLRIFRFVKLKLKFLVF